jgi:voltage-gated potassium channel
MIMFHHRWFAALAFTAALVGLIAVAMFDVGGWTFVALLLAVVAGAVTFFHLAFPGSRFFVIALTNSLGIYACVFQFFMQANFQAVESPVTEIGFALPILAFLGGTWWRRERIRTIIRSEKIEDKTRIGTVLGWLVPVAAIGVATFFVDTTPPATVTVDFVFLLAMFGIALTVFVVSPSVSTFLIDTGLLFEEFFARVNRLAVAAFAFVTFYSVLVIVFAAVYRIIDMFSSDANFTIAGLDRAITFPESLYFSITTMATVGYGDITPATDLARIIAAVQVVLGILLLLFGFSEIMSYTRERRHEPGSR